ncbi:hypothetical protein [Campylobacter hominis]|uniref:hypothetical protein n=1 Tax=Campylobacter hominis TaxID=76517 RepID=UPI0002FC0ACD|nr:hypothetical protein [Campylobacter hominis]UAK85336.1 hypothetical protein K8O82_05560 [Campylobacter hominis]SUW84360.1 Uncharacterised protein [Campylobacter hominis]
MKFLIKILKNTTKSFTFVFGGAFTVAIGIFIFTAAVMIYIDPLKIYHINQEFSKKLYTNMRVQAAGIINNYDFNGLILGTSMLENTSAKEAAKYLTQKKELKFFNLSLSGGNFYKRKFVLDYALRNKNLDMILYSLDDSALINPYEKDSNPSYEHINYDFLYDKNPFNDIKVYFETKFSGCFFGDKNCPLKEVDFDRPNKWFNSKWHSSRFGGFDNWIKFKDDNQIKDAFNVIIDANKTISSGKFQNFSGDFEKQTKYLDDKILKFVKNYPQTDFILILPPYSTLYKAIKFQTKNKEFDFEMKLVKFLVNESKKYSNLKIYGFNDLNFTDDIANYKDLTHYSEKINSLMLKMISNKKGLLTPQNVNNYIEKVSLKAKNFNIEPYVNQVQKALETK